MVVRSKTCLIFQDFSHDHKPALIFRTFPIRTKTCYYLRTFAIRSETFLFTRNFYIRSETFLFFRTFVIRSQTRVQVLDSFTQLDNGGENVCRGETAAFITTSSLRIKISKILKMKGNMFLLSFEINCLKLHKQCFNNNAGSICKMRLT